MGKKARIIYLISVIIFLIIFYNLASAQYGSFMGFLYTFIVAFVIGGIAKGILAIKEWISGGD